MDTLHWAKKDRRLFVGVSDLSLMGFTDPYLWDFPVFMSRHWRGIKFICGAHNIWKSANVFWIMHHFPPDIFVLSGSPVIQWYVRGCVELSIQAFLLSISVSLIPFSSLLSSLLFLLAENFTDATGLGNGEWEAQFFCLSPSPTFPNYVCLFICSFKKAAAVQSTFICPLQITPCSSYQ